MSSVEQVEQVERTPDPPAGSPPPSGRGGYRPGAGRKPRSQAPAESPESIGPEAMILTRLAEGLGSPALIAECHRKAAECHRKAAWISPDHEILSGLGLGRLAPWQPCEWLSALRAALIEAFTWERRAAWAEAMQAGQAPPVMDGAQAAAAIREQADRALLRRFVESRGSLTPVIRALDGSARSLEAELDKARERLPRALERAFSPAERDWTGRALESPWDFLATLSGAETAAVAKLGRVRRTSEALPGRLADRFKALVDSAGASAIAEGLAPPVLTDYGEDRFELDDRLINLRRDLATANGQVDAMKPGPESPDDERLAAARGRITATPRGRIEDRLAELRREAEGHRQVLVEVHSAVVASLVPRVEALASGDLREWGAILESVRIKPGAFPGGLEDALLDAAADALADAGPSTIARAVFDSELGRYGSGSRLHDAMKDLPWD